MGDTTPTLAGLTSVFPALLDQDPITGQGTSHGKFKDGDGAKKKLAFNTRQFMYCCGFTIIGNFHQCYVENSELYGKRIMAQLKTARAHAGVGVIATLANRIHTDRTVRGFLLQAGFKSLIGPAYNYNSTNEVEMFYAPTTRTRETEECDNEYDDEYDDYDFSD